MLRTLGIAYNHRHGHATCCAVQWVSGMALVELPRVGMLDTVLLAEMQRADWTGITGAPFGWPDALLETLATYAETGRWPLTVPGEQVRYRMTDRFVRDLIRDEHRIEIEPAAATSRDTSIAAWRCARLLTAHTERTGLQLDRIGVPAPTALDGPPDLPRGLVEFPPAGVIEADARTALIAWELPHDGYHPNDQLDWTRARDRRREILAEIEAEAGWLLLTDDARSACAHSDDALEALIAAFVACAAATDATIRPTVKQRGAAQREGWIHVPAVAGSLGGLAPTAV